MWNDERLATTIAIAALNVLPPGVRESVLEREDFRQRFSLKVDAVIRFDGAGVEFSRLRLFGAIREVLSGKAESIEISSQEGLFWRVTSDDSTGIVIRREKTELRFHESLCMSPDARARLEWFDRQTTHLREFDSSFRSWRQLLAERPATEEEVSSLIDNLRLTPALFIVSLRELLRSGRFDASDLVPSDIRYFDRLVGEWTEESSFHEFMARTVTSRVQNLVERQKVEGLKNALLLSAHSKLAETLDPISISGEEMVQLFDWMAVHGDRISQIGALECGMRSLREFPEIETSLAAMTRAFVADRPEESEGRLHLLSSLVILVEGELARLRIARERPPFWRRLASIAHASLVEREVIDSHVGHGHVAEWAHTWGGAAYYTQSLVDMRREPRWFPEFLSAPQLKAEFVGRIFGAAERYKENIGAGELRSALWGPASDSVQSQLRVPASFLPGPIEGGGVEAQGMPAGLESSVRASLEGEELTPESLFGLINASLLYCGSSELCEFAAQVLRRIGYRLREIKSKAELSALLLGLAMVSAICRSRELAQGVRILARVESQGGSRKLSAEMVARIGLIAAAANRDAASWREAVGECFTEVAFGSMNLEEALALRALFEMLLHIEPSLWETCSQAEAALTAFIEAFPSHGEGNGSASTA